MLSRLRSAVPASRINLFVHAGNSLAVCASVSEDMVQLRSFMIGATSCSMVYNLLQPTPLWTPVYWGAFFASMHAVQIARILRDNSEVTLSEREHTLYEQAFLPHGFTPRQFLRIMECGSFVTLTPGDACAKQGEPVKALHCITSCSQNATVEMQQESTAPDGDQKLRRLDSTDGVLSRVQPANLGGGLWVGEVWDPGKLRALGASIPTSNSGDHGGSIDIRSIASVASAVDIAASSTTSTSSKPPARASTDAASSKPRSWLTSVRAVGGPVEAVRFDYERFHAALHELGPRAQHAAERMQLANLQAERSHLNGWQAQLQTRNRKRLRALEERHLREKQLATYTAMVALAVADGRVSHQEREACRAFREAHAIGEDQHREALKAAGWEGKYF